MKLRIALTAVVVMMAAAMSGCVQGEGSGGSGANDREIHLDYAYYNPLSLVVRDQRLLENNGISTTWVLSAGSNKANENLRAKAIDLGSTAGSAALLARANGTAIKTVGVYSKPEWVALVVPANSTISEPSQLRGKKIAATKGTDAYFFLLQTLATAGLSGKDVEVVNLQHADGKTALERGDVDAWAGLDPYLAQARQDSGARLIYRNPDFSTYGVLNAREDFITAHPDLVQAVVDAYAQARTWAAQHPNELIALLAREAKVTPAVAAEELERTVLATDPVPGDAQRAVLDRVLPIIVSDGSVRSESAARDALDSLIEPKFAARQGS
jgi:sulfonate transport system substrate-binding protein